MGRIALGVALALAVGWFMFGRGGDAAAVTDCLKDAGAAVDESPRFAQMFPYAIAVRSLDRVESYPELEGGRFFAVRYASGRALLFVAKGDEEAAAFERTLAGLVSGEGGAVTSRRSGKALLVWERPVYAPELDRCFA